MALSGSPLGTIQKSASCGACGPANNVQANCNALGPEWTYDSYGSCGECKFNCVSFGALGTACTSGAYAQCRKFQYTGDKTNCCLGIAPPGWPTLSTCDPGLSPTAPTCSTVLQNFCSNGSNVFTDNRCKLWASANANQAFTLKANYCSQNGRFKSDSNCRQFALDGNTQGKIDSLMTNYCASNPNDPLCACINSQIPCPNKFDGHCVQGGYQTYGMVTTPCPNVLSCNQFVNLSPNAKSIATNVEQNCPSSNGSSPNGVPSNGSASNGSPSGGSSSNFSLDLIILIFFFILVIITASTTYYFWLSDDNSDQS